MIQVMKKEARLHGKTFVIFAFGFCLLMMIGMGKYTGFSGAGGESITDLLEQLPRVFLVVVGLNDLDLSTLGGYYGVLAAYGYVMVGLLAIALGVRTVTYERNEKMADFLYTKPMKRSHILLAKMAVAILFLIGLALLSIPSVAIGLRVIGAENTITTLVVQVAISYFFVGLLFYGVSFYCGSILTKGAMAVANGIFLATYTLGVVYEMIEGLSFLRLVAPIKYFSVPDMIGGAPLEWQFIVLTLTAFVLLIILSLKKMKTKDL